jgi:hypothetical protein
MAITYDPIATTTLGTAANISFTSIPITYTDLRVVITGSMTNNGYYTGLRFSGVTSALYSSTSLRGNGTTASSNNQASNNYMTLDNGGGAASSTIPQLVTIDIFNYYSGSNFVTVLATLSQDKNGSGEVTRTVGLLRDTFVTSIDLSPTSSWAAGTTATLYGIKAA